MPPRSPQLRFDTELDCLKSHTMSCWSDSPSRLSQSIAQTMAGQRECYVPLPSSRGDPVIAPLHFQAQTNRHIPQPGPDALI